MGQLIKQAGILFLGNVVIWWVVSAIAWGCGRIFPAGIARRRIERDAATPSESRQALVYTLTRSLAALAVVQTLILTLLPQPVPGPAKPLFIVLEIVAGLVVFDLGFYLSHRLLHHRRFWRFHQVHHRYRLVNLWVRNADQVAQVLVVAVFAAPVNLVLVHIEAKIAFFVLSTVWNLLQHTGYEVFPRWRWLSRVFVTPTHHSMHHTEVDCNFAYFFTLWDDVFGTLHPANRARFLQRPVAEQPAVDGQRAA
jgi:sterol desaturase/sphingolipid hydroxylase (fatty acid hydroxylase superfamily)